MTSDVAPGPLPRVNVLGVGVNAINMSIAVRTIAAWIARQERHYVCVRDVHGIMQSHRDIQLKRIHNRAGLVTPDGMPLVWLCKLAGHRQADRVYGPDLMHALCAHSVAAGWRHYLYGGGPGVAERLRAKLTERFAGLQIVGTHTPPFGPCTPEEDQRIIEQINRVRPEIVWVGLSTPKQERWIAAHRDLLQAPVMIGVGAAFDFHAGLKRQAPRWIQRSGMEWFFRLCTEPRRLGKRYLVNNPAFLWNLACQKLRLRQYPIES